MGRRVDLDDLIDVREVADLLGLSHPNSVTTYAQRYADFPQPLLRFASGKCQLWSRTELLRWLRQRSR